MLHQRKDYLDGIRAVAAMYVVVYHIFINYVLPSLSLRMAELCTPLTYGRIGVAAFIVVSGYCLGASKRPAPEFLKRRAIRILPPYWAALLLCLAVKPATAPQLVAHALLIQNLRSDWTIESDYVLWSVATECQFYLLFPLINGIARRNAVRAIMISLALTASAVILLSVSKLNLASAPWLLISFTLGIVLANARPIAPVQWGAVVSAIAIVFIATELAFPTYQTYGSTSREAARELLGSAFTAAIIAWCETTPGGVMRRVLSMRALVFVGTISYSLYLIHIPVLQTLKRLHAPVAILGFGLCLLAACAFHVVFERPFMKYGAAPRHRLEAEKETTLTGR